MHAMLKLCLLIGLACCSIDACGAHKQQAAINKQQNSSAVKSSVAVTTQINRMDDAELAKMADSFALDRKMAVDAAKQQQGELMTVAAIEETRAQLANSANKREQLKPSDKANAAAEDDQWRQSRIVSDLQHASSQQQQQQVDASSSTGQLENDSTERHIKFTLDLMQAMFASQSTSHSSLSQTNNAVESFLISPLSIQMVLMMMHAGARGQTKRELANCLHLLTNFSQTNSQVALNSEQVNSASSIKSNVSGTGSFTYAADSGAPSSSDASNVSQSSTDSSALARIRRRHQQQRQTSSASSQPKPSANKQQYSSTSTNHHNKQPPIQQQQTVSSQNNGAHELFSAALRNLLKDPLVAKALTSANQIFVQKSLPLAPQYEWAMRNYYGTEMKQVDFAGQSSGVPRPSSNGSPQSLNSLQDTLGTRQHTNSNSSGVESTATNNNIQQLINEWVERQTRGKIVNFLSGPVPSSTLLMAINVLFFKGDWQYKFDPADTEQDAVFTHSDSKTTSRMPMMVGRLPLAFAHDATMKTSVIELPYKAQRLGLFLLLPDDTAGIYNTMQQLNSTSFANLISSMRKPAPMAHEQGSPGGINVRIPKFTIESSPRISQILTEQLGIKTLFTPDTADLSGMFAPTTPPSAAKRQTSVSTNSNATIQSTAQMPQVGLDELLHKAVLQVHEQGSVAAAASATIVERLGMFNSNYFEADHPFLLFLMDKQTGLVLFAGAFAGPNPNASDISQHNSPNSDGSVSNVGTNNTKSHDKP